MYGRISELNANNVTIIKARLVKCDIYIHVMKGKETEYRSVFNTILSLTWYTGNNSNSVKLCVVPIKYTYLMRIRT